MIDSYNMEMEYMYMGCVAGTRLLSFFALFMIVGVLTRSAIQSSMLCEGTFKHPLQEAVTAFEVYGCNIGHIYVFQIYGLGTYFVVLLAVGVYHAFFLKGFTANPMTHILQYLMNRSPQNETITKILTLVLGGLVGQITAILFWTLLMTEFDKETLTQMHCVAVRASLPAAVCLGVEFFGTVLICILVIHIASSSVDAFEPPMKFLITGLLSGAGLCVSNVYLNPVVASSRLIGCYGKDFFHHLVIYWMAPIGGAAVAVLQTKVISHNCDLASLPFCKCLESCLQSGKVCTGLQSDVINPDLLRLQNTFRQVPRSSTLLLSNRNMPTIYVSSTDEDEDGDENSDDEVLYSCTKYSNVGRVNGLNYNELDDMKTCHRRCTEPPFDDAYCSRVSESVMSRKTNGKRSCAPISSAGQIPHINQSPLCGDLRTVRDCRTVAYSCHCQTESRPYCASVHCITSTCDTTNNIASASCTSKDANNAQLLPTSENYLKSSSCLVPAQLECNSPGDQSSTVRGASDNVCSSPEKDNCTRDILKITASPKRKSSLRFKLPIQDHSKNKDTDEEDELVAKPSFHRLKKIVLPIEFDEKPSQHDYELQSPQNYSSQSLIVGPSQDEYVLQSPQEYSSHISKVEPSQDECMPQSPQKYSSGSSKVGPSQDAFMPQSSQKYSSHGCVVGPSQVECMPKSPQKHSSPSCVVGPSQGAGVPQSPQKFSFNSSKVKPSQDAGMLESPQKCSITIRVVGPSQNACMPQSPQKSCSSKVESSQDASMPQSPQKSCSSKVESSQDASMPQSPQKSCSSKVESSQDASMPQSPQKSCSSKVESSQDESIPVPLKKPSAQSCMLEPSQDESMPKSSQKYSSHCSKVGLSQDACMLQSPPKYSSCSSNVRSSQNKFTPLPLKKPSTQSCIVEPSQDKCMPMSPQRYSSCSSKVGLSQGARMSQSPQKYSTRSSEMGPSQDDNTPLTPKKPSVQSPQLTQIPKKSLKHVSRDSPNSHLKPSHQSPADTNHTHSHIQRHKSPHKDKHAKPSQKCPLGAHPTPTHSVPHKRIPEYGTHKTVHLGPTNACPTPLPNNRHERTPSSTKDRPPSGHRSRDASIRRASPTRSKQFPPV